MSKKVLIFTIVVLVLLGGGYWYYTQKGVFPGGQDLFPGGSSAGPTGEKEVPRDASTTETPTPENIQFPRLYQLHASPVSGIGFFETFDKKGTTTNITIRYIERGLGHIYETNLSTYGESRIINETRPRISEAFWGNNGKSVVIRFLDAKDTELIKTHVINIANTGTSTPETAFETEEIFLPDAIPFMAIADDRTNNLFYLEGERGVITDSQNTFDTEIFNSKFTEWIPQYPNQKLITLTTRPSAEVPGHMFSIDPKTKAVTKIIGGINGLTTLTSRDGKYVLYSETVGKGFELFVYNTTTKTASPVLLSGLPEKCVWGTKNTATLYCAIPQTLPRATYPDQWYQGLVSFSDTLWKINAGNLETQRVVVPGTLGIQNLDITNLALASNEDYLIFIDKKTSSPWLYSLTVAPPWVPQQPQTPSAASSRTTEATTTKNSVAPSVITSGMQKLK